MNHKRRRSKQLRAGCLLCKPNKLGKGMEKRLGHRGDASLKCNVALDVLGRVCLCEHFSVPGGFGHGPIPKDVQGGFPMHS